MSLHIRPFSPDDYPVALELYNAVEPEYPMTVAEWQHWDTHQDPKLRWGRYLADWDGQPAAVLSYEQSEELYHPRKFHLSINVHPGFRRRGVGAASFEHLLQELEPLDPIEVRSEVREDRPEALRFVERHGFTESMREWESRLDLEAFDPTPFAEAVERVEAQGIRLLTFAELQREDPDWARKLHALKTVLDRDVPSPDEVTETDFDTWLQRTLNNPNLVPDGWIIAVHNGEYVGESSFNTTQAGDFLEVGLTAVRREYRRRGIALALKTRATTQAARMGYKSLRTWNATTNEAMLAINIRMGFQRQPAWIFYSKALKPATG